MGRNELLVGLNDEQLKVVLHEEGPLLVIAGAGSGKTGCFTRRIARLVLEEKAGADEILAITFTNKAAHEIQERVASFLGKRAASKIMLSTYHSFAHKLLRGLIGHVPSLKRNSYYSILDRSGQIKEVTRVIKDLNLDIKDHKPQTYLELFQKAKNRGEFPWLAEYEGVTTLSPQKVAEAYEKRLRSMNAVDFGDLLHLTTYILSQRPDLCDAIASRYRYIMVDEYQDTNPVQLKLVEQLTRKNRNLAVVGDDSQTIFEFQGASARTILDFPRDHPGCTTVALVQNYRSTSRIVAAAQQLIGRNKNGFKKNCFSSDVREGSVQIFRYPSDRDEAQKLVDLLVALQQRGDKWGDMAMLFRLNAQSRVLEEQFIRRGIPYRLKGGFKFYDRIEIQDCVAWMKLFVNPENDSVWERCLQAPSRGIGNTTIAAVQAYAKHHSLTFAKAIEERHLYLKPAVVKKLDGFMNQYEKLRPWCSKELPETFMRRVLQDIGFELYIKGADNQAVSQEDLQRWNNVRELFGAIKQYETNTIREERVPRLDEFLEQVALLAEEVGQDLADKDCVQLMTAHSAKGLEFKTVIVVGAEEGVFPLSKEELEGERRLFYVAMTRAKLNLFFSHVDTRFLYGTPKTNPVSRFISEAFDRK